MRAPNQTRKMTACCSKVGIKRGPWTPEEDEILANFVKKEGEGRWRTLPKRAGLQRCGKSCRLRWMNYLRPSVKRGHIAPDEEDLILRLHRLLGNRWSLIAGRIPGRTDNEIKNYWNTHLSKKLISQGIDPRTHKPLITYNIASDPNETDTTSNPDHSIPQITTACTPALGIGNCSLSHDQNQTEAIQFQNMEMERYSCSEMTGVEVGRQHEKTVGEEDYTLSSFLDSLLNDNCVVGSQQPLTSSLQSFDLAFWEAEFPSATGKDEINIK